MKNKSCIIGTGLIWLGIWIAVSMISSQSNCQHKEVDLVDYIKSDFNNKETTLVTKDLK